MSGPDAQSEAEPDSEQDSPPDGEQDSEPDDDADSQPNSRRTSRLERPLPLTVIVGIFGILTALIGGVFLVLSTVLPILLNGDDDKEPPGPGRDAHLGKLVVVSGGTDAGYYITPGGQRERVLNYNIQECLRVRLGIGNPDDTPIPIDPTQLSSFPESGLAHCPYETEPGINFVFGPDKKVWLVMADGTKREALSLCGGDVAYTKDSQKRWYVHPIPHEEADGHVTGEPWEATSEACAALK